MPNLIQVVLKLQVDTYNASLLIVHRYGSC